MARGQSGRLPAGISSCPQGWQIAHAQAVRQQRRGDDGRRRRPFRPGGAVGGGQRISQRRVDRQRCGQAHQGRIPTVDDQANDSQAGSDKQRSYALALGVLSIGIILIGILFGPWFEISRTAAAALF